MPTNSFGDLKSSRMIHDIVDDLVADLKPILRLAKSFSEKQANDVVLRSAAPGSIIKIEDWNLRAGIGDLYDVDPLDGYTAQDLTRKTQRSFTLPETIKAVSVAITPAEYRLLISDNVGIDGWATFRDRLRQAMVYKFAKGVVAAFFAVLDDAGYTYETAVATFNRAKELAVEKRLFDRNLASKNGATIIVNSQLYLDYVSDIQVIQNYTGVDLANKTMMNTIQSQVSPFSITRTTETLPTTAAKGFAYTETAAFFVARVPDEPTFEGDPVSLETVVHPEVELPMLFRVWKDSKTGVMQMDMATIFAFYKNQIEAVERLIAA